MKFTYFCGCWAPTSRKKGNKVLETRVRRALTALGRQAEAWDMPVNNRVTVGVDGSESSTHALDWAAREAVQRGARLHVVKAYMIPVYAAEFVPVYPSVDAEELRNAHVAAVEQQLKAARSRFPELPIDVSIELGSATETLIVSAEESDLVVAGSHGAGSIAALFLGSVAHSLAHRSPCPAVLVPTGTIANGVERIVVGTDGSPAATAAVRWARAEAARWDAELTVVHAWEYPYRTDPESASIPSEMMELDAENMLARAAHEHDEHHPARAGKDHVRLISGSPGKVLVNESSEAHLLVVGATGRGPLRSALLGSTSSHALHHAHCPVAVIHSA